MYSEKVMDHFNNPRNVGEIENASGVGTVGNAKCGDITVLYLQKKQFTQHYGIMQRKTTLRSKDWRNRSMI